MIQKISSDLIRGHTDTILLSLLIQRDMYGYELYKKIVEMCNHKYELKEATLYASFRRMEKKMLINSYWGEESQGGRRKYYKITKEGLEFYREKVKEWNFTKSIVDIFLKEG